MESIFTPLLLLLTLCRLGEAAPVSLFNGQNLEGWEGETASVWRVIDEVIVGGSLEGNPQNEFLATKKKYRNFILKLEYKLIGNEGFVNGGVQFRSVRILNPPNELSGYQADIGAGYSGCLYDESRRKTMLAKPEKELVDAIEKPGEWNRYELRAEEQHIQLFLNGTRTVDFTEREAGMDMSGVIALQIHGKCKAQVSFRNIVIEALPDALVPDEVGKKMFFAPFPQLARGTIVGPSWGALKATDPSEPSGSWPLVRMTNFNSTYHPSELYPPSENNEEPKNEDGVQQNI